MKEIFTLLKFNWYYWLLQRDLMEEELDVSPLLLNRIKRCYSVIPEQDYSRLSRSHLQKMVIETHTGGFEQWQSRVEEAVGIMNGRTGFPSTWSFMRDPQLITFMEYANTGRYWRPVETTIREIMSSLETLLLTLSKLEGAYLSSNIRKVRKLLDEGVGVLVMLLVDYKESSWEEKSPA